MNAPGTTAPLVSNVDIPAPAIDTSVAEISAAQTEIVTTTTTITTTPPAEEKPALNSKNPANSMSASQLLRLKRLQDDQQPMVSAPGSMPILDQTTGLPGSCQVSLYVCVLSTQRYMSSLFFVGVAIVDLMFGTKKNGKVGFST